MYIFISLFFISLISILFLVFRKVLLLNEINTEEGLDITFDMPDLEEIQEITIKKTKVYGYIALVSTIRIYLKTSAIAKKQYKNIKNNIKKIHNKYVTKKTKEIENKKEVSGFLKMISNYKNKINQIKQKIKEEEDLN